MRRIASLVAGICVAAALVAAPAAQAVPAMPQGYPIEGLYQKCSASEAPDWRYGETARRYLSDGTIQFANTTDQTVDYTGKVETGTNHKIAANSAAALPSGWNTTAQTDIGLKESNGWLTEETFGPVSLKPGESFRVEYGVLEKDFISMFVTCNNGYRSNEAGANVIRGTGPAERYAFAYIIRADGSVSDLAMNIPSRSAGANSKPSGATYHEMSGPSLEKLAKPQDRVIPPNDTFQRNPAWPPRDKSATITRGTHSISRRSPLPSASPDTPRTSSIGPRATTPTTQSLITWWVLAITVIPPPV